MSETQGKLLSKEELKAIDDEYLHDGLRPLKTHVHKLLESHRALTLQLAKTRAEAIEEAALTLLDDYVFAIPEERLTDEGRLHKRYCEAAAHGMRALLQSKQEGQL